MKIGNLHVTWVNTRQTQILRDEVRNELRLPEVKNSIAKLARSEVKNYLAALAEEAEMPFSNPAAFLAYVRASVAMATVQFKEAQPTDLAEYPFEVGGYANHPEQKEYDLQPFPPADSSDPYSVLRNLEFKPTAETWDDILGPEEG